MNKLPWTHFVTTAPNTNHAFCVETCDRCGGKVEAANAVTLMGSAAKLKAMGMVEMTGTLEEIFYNDDVDMAVCTSCDGEIAKAKKA